ncbi:hypothetical protein TIFTF001_038284 [Ficus carica]|uniref:DUF8039 domain-containing protein n=1 Tax=Ficus carica TaxID=3494 RepID=A0AA88E7Q1_FICCA|nr:hypothetical protein TIFTF001_038284 [Ficus carica]
MEVVISFTVEPSFKKKALKSCAESAKNFRYDLYQAFVRDHIDEETVWHRLPKVVHNYPTISQDDWKKFIEDRRTPEFKRLSGKGSEIRKKSKYGSTGGRDGYRKCDQDHFVKTGKWAERHDSLSHNKRTVQELCAKHGINRETMTKETTAPTVDQHNSFMASCTLNEKEAGPSDPKPMPNSSQECQLFLPDLVNGGDVLVAIGRPYTDCVPIDTVHGILLGEENVRVTITVPKLKRALLPIPTNEATCIEEAVGGFVSWPKRLVIVQTSLSQASQGLSHALDRKAEGSKRTKKRAGRKKIQSQPEVQQQPTQQELPSYLANCCARTGMDQWFEFISPVFVSPIQQNVDRTTYVRERADYILRILRNVPKGKLFLMPYNSGQHWLLAVIDPWEDSVMYFNPLGNDSGDDFKDLITTALNDWKLSMGRGIRQRRNCQTLIDTVQCPIHEGRALVLPLDQVKRRRAPTRPQCVPCHRTPHQRALGALSQWFTWETIMVALVSQKEAHARASPARARCATTTVFLGIRSIRSPFDLTMWTLLRRVALHLPSLLRLNLAWVQAEGGVQAAWAVLAARERGKNEGKVAWVARERGKNGGRGRGRRGQRESEEKWRTSAWAARERGKNGGRGRGLRGWLEREGKMDEAVGVGGEGKIERVFGDFK